MTRDTVVTLDSRRTMPTGERPPTILEELQQNNRVLKAERDAAIKDAERYRYLRSRTIADVFSKHGPDAGCWIDCEMDDELVLLTGDDADAAIDAARGEDLLSVTRDHYTASLEDA